MLLKKALLHIYGVRSIYNIVNVCRPFCTASAISCMLSIVTPSVSRQQVTIFFEILWCSNGVLRCSRGGRGIFFNFVAGGGSHFQIPIDIQIDSEDFFLNMSREMTILFYCAFVHPFIQPSTRLELRQFKNDSMD